MDVLYSSIMFSSYTQAKPWASLLEWSSMTWMVWGYLHGINVCDSYSNQCWVSFKKGPTTAYVASQRGLHWAFAQLGIGSVEIDPAPVTQGLFENWLCGYTPN